MAKRKLSATADVGLRLKEGMRSALAKSAKRAGISMNAEIVSRLDQTLYDDQRLSGPRVKRISDMLAMVFSVRGSVGSRDFSDPNPIVDWTDDAWVDDERIFYDAAAEVVKTLIDMGPGNSFAVRRRRLLAAMSKSFNKRLAPEHMDRFEDEEVAE